jgi:hypothetical protein
MQSIVKQNTGWRQATSQFEAGLRERWDAMALPGGEHQFSDVTLPKL